MKLAVNKTVRGKPTTIEQNKKLTTTFENIDVSQEELGQLIDKGYSFCSQHKNNRRCTKNFTCSGYIAVDIDSGLTLDEALSHPFVKQYAAIIYTTESHTEEDHRFRIIFETETPITDKKDMRLALSGLVKQFGGDTSCKDPCRQFYGSSHPNTQVFNKVLSNSALQKLLVLGTELGRNQTTDNKASQGPGKRASIVSRIMLDPDLIVTTKDGEQHRLIDVPERTAIYCPVHIDHSPSAFTLQSKTGVVGVHCSTCATTYYTSRDIPLYDFNYGLRNIRNLKVEDYEILEYEGGVVTSSPSLIFLDQPYLPERLTNTDITFVRSPKGTGKTYWLEKIVKHYKTARTNREGNIIEPDSRTKKVKGAHVRYTSILLIGHRKTLIQSMASRLDLTPYQETVTTWRDDASFDKSEYKKPTHYYAICADSLHTLLEPSKDKYDVVIIDEVEQVLSHFTGDTLKEKRNETFLYLKHYLDVAKKVYVLDADLNALTVNTVADLLTNTGKSITFIDNQYKTAGREISLYQRKLHLTDELMRSVEKGDRCFVCTNSRAQVKKFTGFINDHYSGAKKVISITSENSQNSDIQAFLGNIKKSILEYDVIIVSPSVGTGIDITFPDKSQSIDVVYGFFESRINTHFDIDQQLSRVRHPKCIRAWISPETFRFSIDPKIIKREVGLADRTMKRLTGIQPDGTEIYDTNDEYLNLYANVKAMERGSKNNLLYHFKKMKEHYGWKIIGVEACDEAVKSGLEISHRSKQIYEEERIKKIASARPITSDDYSDLDYRKKTISLSDDLKAAMRRYEIESFYLTEVSEELIKEDKNGNRRNQIRTYEMYTLDEGDLLVKDVINQKYASHITDRKELRLRSELLYKIFSSAGLADENNRVITEKLIEGDSLSEFAKLCIKHKERIARFFNIDIRKDVEKKPAQQLSRFLKLLGITWKKTGYVTKKGERVNCYTIPQEVIDELEEIVNHRSDLAISEQWHEQRNEITENQLFDKDGQSKFYQIKEHILSAS